ncbi:MAG: porin [candidate division WOR-3 bacterium]
MKKNEEVLMNPSALPLIILLCTLAGLARPAGTNVSFHAAVSSACAWEQYRSSGLGSARFDFFPPRVPVGLMISAGPTAIIRLYTDATMPTTMPMREFYAEVRFPAGWAIRAGQIVPPYAREALTPYEQLWFLDYSLLRDWWDHGAPTDVGVQAACSTSSWSLTAALVNGNDGRSLVDDNRAKDLCVRAVVNPRGDRLPGAAARVYLGRTDAGVQFRSIAAELWFETGPLALSAQAQNAAKGPYVRTAAALAAHYRLTDWLAPALSLQTEFQNDDRYDLLASSMLRFGQREQPVTAGLGYDFRLKDSNTPSARFTKHRVLLQLLIAL